MDGGRQDGSSIVWVALIVVLALGAAAFLTSRYRSPDAPERQATPGEPLARLTVPSVPAPGARAGVAPAPDKPAADGPAPDAPVLDERAAAATNALAASEPPAWTLSRGSIVYESRAGNRKNIHRYDAGAAAPVKLTAHAAIDQRPRWSPDGTRVAFFSNLHGSDDVFVIDAEGGTLVRITHDPGTEKDPAWMPDGRLVYTSDRDGDDNLYLLDPASGEETQITHYDGGRTGGPSVSADGTRVAFTSDRLFSWQVYVVDLADGAIERLTGPLPGACNPTWSPRDGRIVYMSGGSTIGTDLRSVTPQGGDKRAIGTDAGNNHDPEFSEDGRRLVWASDRHGNWEIYEAAADGGGESRISRTPRDERHPDLFLGDTRR